MIAVRPRLTTHSIFSLANLIMAVLFVAVLLIFVQMSLRDNRQDPMIGGTVRQVASVEGACLAGPLSLNESSRSPLALSLEKQLVLLAQSVRPDWSQGQRAFRIGVRGTGVEQVVHEGEAIFCNLDLHASGGAQDISFASDSGDVKMVPQVIDSRSLKLLVEQTGREAFEVVLKSGGISSRAELPDPVESLQQAFWVGQDAFFSKYGGEVYRELGAKQKVAIETDMLYVSDGDYISYENGNWRVLDSLKEASAEALLGAVHFNERGNLDLEVWDSKGFSILQTELTKNSAMPIKTKPSQLITQPKRRTAQGVSCKIGKQRWILKPGDWLIATENGIHRLETTDEIEQYLAQKLEGELIVIDQYDDGHLTGHVIGEWRTKTEPFSIQVAGSQAKGRAQK